MTRAEYEAKYGTPPATKAAPVKMTRAAYEAKYGAPAKPEQQPGFVQSLLNAPARLGANIALAANAGDPAKYEQIKREGIAPTGAGLPQQYQDNFNKAFPGGLAKVKPVGMQDDAGAIAKDIGGVGLEGASLLAGGGGVPKVLSKIVQGAVGRAAISGGISGAISGGTYGAGAELQDPNSSAKTVATKTALGTGLGTLGAPLGVMGALGSKAVQIARKPAGAFSEATMQRVARIPGSKQSDFEKLAGESVGKYLVKRGIYGDPDKVISRLYTNFNKSRNKADEALAQLPGLHKAKPVETALAELFQRETRISSPGALSKDFARIRELKNKYTKDGLDMSEINEVKRLYERNIKLEYARENISDKTAKATTLDSALRKWQLDQAEKLGLTNLQDLNRETMLARQLADALGEQNRRQAANNAVSITDYILLSGEPTTAIPAFLGKQFFGSAKVQSSLAKTFAPAPKVGDPVKVFGEPKAGGFGDFIKSTEVPSKLPRTLRPPQLQPK